MLMNPSDQMPFMQPAQSGDGSDALKYYFREALVAAQNLRGGNIVHKMGAANTRLQQIGVEDSIRNQIMEGLMKTLSPEQQFDEGMNVDQMGQPQMYQEFQNRDPYNSMGERRQGYPPVPPEMGMRQQDDIGQHARPQYSNFSNPSTPSLGRLNLSSPSNAMRGYDEPQRSMDNYSEPSSIHAFQYDRRSPHSYPRPDPYHPEGNSRSSLSDMPQSDQCLDPHSGTSYDSAGSDRHMGIQLGDKSSNSREKKPQKNVQQLQTLYVRYHGRQRAESAMHWSSSCSLRENETAVPTGEPIAMSMAIVNAPASMSLPCKPNKLFHPPFKVRVYVGYHHDLRYRCRVQAYVLCEQQVDNLGIWVPETHGLGEGFDKGSEEYVFELTEEEIQRQQWRTSSEQRMMHHDFEFTDMRFQSPSRMKKRWIVFVCNAPNNDLLLCLYKVPTVVVSRSIDQYNKALLILQGIVPKDGRSMRGKMRDGVRGLRADDKLLGMGGEKVNRRNFQQYVIKTYQSMDLGERMLNEEDMAGLEAIAGFPTDVSNPTMDMEARDQEQLTNEQWQAFESWWDACLKMLSNVRHLWLTLTPVIICSFAVDRDRATAFLVDKPPETFLIRISTTRPGCFVISRRLKEGSSGKEQQEWVKHAVLHSQDVHDRAMETWIRDMQGVAQLLNVGDMQLVPKQDIFHTGYRRMNTAPGTHGVAGEAGIINFEMENAGYNIRLPPQPVDMPDHHMAMDIGEVAM